MLRQFFGRGNRRTGVSLSELYAMHYGKVSDKWAMYLDVYGRIFGEYRERPVSLLEIGIQNGGSLEIWSQYFYNAEILIGCDINPGCLALSYDDSRISVIVGDANSDSVLSDVIKKSKAFDIIVDDGSHISEDIVKSFFRYFPLVTEGGVYVAEDLHCSYWEAYHGGLFDPSSSISFFKLLADVVNIQHWGIEMSPKDLLAAFNCPEDFTVSIFEQIHSVEFVNSMCVVRKKSSTCNVLGHRVIAGEIEQVVGGLRNLHGTTCPKHSQINNKYSVRPEATVKVIDSWQTAVHYNPRS